MMGHFPKRFYIWCSIRTIFQVAISFYALDFVINSNFFHPSGYQSDAWNKEHLRVMYLPQAVFELLDLLMELWMLRKENSKAHLPWDSIIHHGVSGMYALYIYVYADSLSHEFLGLAVAALSCQVIGPLYTIYRMKFRFKYLGLVILAVQLLYRCPLALVSCLRYVLFYIYCYMIFLYFD